ncbi:hypothetical protein F5148DRAFT_1286176 [Russula earlei]|uniref:Uncharacterized protein n=1 Tax=Russula earlei TaxID=71964 RepID=A0ACC0U6C2_9AGAM|nr:hypothetical protein F5148DRAFT_1286176 [Russula earlei]
MKPILLFISCLLSAVCVFSQSTSLQWTREEKLPSSDIFTLFYYRDTLYAGGSDKIYIGRYGGQTWDSTAIVLPNLYSIDAITEFNNELYAASYSTGVFKSNDVGKHWQNITGGLFPYVSKFYEWKGNLYAATLGEGIYKLDSATHNTWTAFNNGVSLLSYNLYTITGNSNTLLAAGGANGNYLRLPASSTQWEEDLLEGTLRPGLWTYDATNSNDSFFVASSDGRGYVFMSTDDAHNWQNIGTFPSSGFLSLLNSQQAILLARYYFNGINNIEFYYRYKNLKSPWVSFSIVQNYDFAVAITGDRLWYGGGGGLYYMPLSNLPGITPVNNTDSLFLAGPVYPNPAAGQCHIDITLPGPQQLNADLYDAAGKHISIIADHQTLHNGNTTLNIDLQQLAAGMYFLHLMINGQSFTKKIIHIPG